MPSNGQKFVMHLSHEKASVLMKWAREWESCRTFVHERFDLKVRLMTCPRSFCVEPSGQLPIRSNSRQSGRIFGQTSNYPLPKRTELNSRWKPVLQLSLEKWPVILQNVRPWKSVRRFTHCMLFGIWKILK